MARIRQSAKTTTTTPNGATPMPRDVEALEAILQAIEGAESEVDAYRAIVESLVPNLDLGYGSVWLPDAATPGGWALKVEAGPLTHRMRQVGADGGHDELIQAAISSQRPVSVEADVNEGAARSSKRWQAAVSDGMRGGCTVPIVEHGKVVAVQEYFSSSTLPFFGNRRDKWNAIARIASGARRGAVARGQLKETADDRLAVTTVVKDLARTTEEKTAINVALQTVRSAFGWDYGSFWALDETTGVLKFEMESGSAGEEFRKVTLAATFAEGVGLSGRAWRSRDLVFVKDLAELTDCVRAPAAGRAGVKSGVCFPILDGDRVIGTMDFFTTAVLDLSDSRASALRNVQQLVSQHLTVLRRVSGDELNARALMDTISRLRDATMDAGRVADEAVRRASAMTDEMNQLLSASSQIGDVIKIITSIAGQTNLLALNATIEAARAGEIGRGFAVVANEVKELARETADATSRVADQIAGIQASSEAVSAGIGTTSAIIGELDGVQAKITAVLEEQAEMADRLIR